MPEKSSIAKESRLDSIQELASLLNTEGDKKKTRAQRKKNVDLENYIIEHFDYGYVNSCTDLDELEQILAVLKSKKEGYYPDFERSVEERIRAVSGEPAETEESEQTCKCDQKSSASKELDSWISDQKKQNLWKSQLSLSDNNETLSDVVGAFEEKLVPGLGAVVNLDKSLDSKNLQALAKSEKVKGNESLASNDVKEAVVYYTRSLQLNPTCQCFSNRSLAYFKLGEFERAENDCIRAIQLVKETPQSNSRLLIKCLLRLGKARTARGKYIDAIESYDEALEIAPTDLELLAARKEAAQKYQSSHGIHARSDIIASSLTVEAQTLKPSDSEETIVVGRETNTLPQKIRMSIVEVEEDEEEEPNCVSLTDFVKKEYVKNTDSSLLNF